ncbi:MAG TPA: sigma-70 family RNA polymerase sigma factor [Puia sp.]|nr:sigma-70 family RNA polymerase sigma factor [Puia sp.]
MEAEDITIDTFVKLWQNREKFESEAHIKRFLFKTAKHASIDFHRDKRRKKYHQDYLQSTFEENDPIKDMPYDERIFSALNGCIQNLSNQRRQILKLKLKGLSAPTISSILNIPEPQVHDQMSKARKQLQKCLRSKL